jgi:hypothetical protein
VVQENIAVPYGGFIAENHRAARVFCSTYWNSRHEIVARAFCALGTVGLLRSQKLPIRMRFSGFIDPERDAIGR